VQSFDLVLELLAQRAECRRRRRREGQEAEADGVELAVKRGGKGADGEGEMRGRDEVGLRGSTLTESARAVGESCRPQEQRDRRRTSSPSPCSTPLISSPSSPSLRTATSSGTSSMPSAHSPTSPTNARRSAHSPSSVVRAERHSSSDVRTRSSSASRTAEDGEAPWARDEVEFGVGVRAPRREARPGLAPPKVAESGEALGDEAAGELRVTKRV